MTNRFLNPRAVPHRLSSSSRRQDDELIRILAPHRVLYEAASRERVILRRPSALTVRILEVLGWDQAFRVIHEPPPKPPARPPVRFTTKGY